MGLIDQQEAIDALWKALFEYEDKTEKQFLESDELDIRDWMLHRIFVQNMSNIDRETILNLSSAQPERKKGRWQITDAYPHNVYCSECHAKFAQTHWAVWEDGSLPRNFCPNCGKPMERGDDNG